MSAALRAGFRSVARNWGLVVLVLLANLALALVLAVPLSMQLEGDLANRGAASGMMYGFDHDWWAEWSERQEGPSSALSPDILGTGFASRNLELLLQGALPGGLFARGGRALLDPTILGVGVVYLLLQVFLTGGLLGVFRSPGGGWTARACSLTRCSTRWRTCWAMAWARSRASLKFASAAMRRLTTHWAKTSMVTRVTMAMRSRVLSDIPAERPPSL